MKILFGLTFLCFVSIALSDHDKSDHVEPGKKHEHHQDRSQSHIKENPIDLTIHREKRSVPHHEDGKKEHHDHAEHFKVKTDPVTYSEAVQICQKMGRTIPHRSEAPHIHRDIGPQGNNRSFWICWAHCEENNGSLPGVLHADGDLTPPPLGHLHSVICQSSKVLSRHKRFIFRHFHLHHHHRHHHHHHHRRHYNGNECVCTCAGDPHYRTFNGQMLSFQNICRYVLLQNTGQGVCPFSIEGQNWVAGHNRRVSYIHYVVIKMNDQEYRMLRGLKIRVNGQIVHSVNDGQVSIQRRGRQLYFVARQCGNIRVEWNGNNKAVIRVPKNLAGKIGGVCGNCDGNPGSDWRTKDGRRVRRRGGLYNGEAIGLSWAVPSDDGRVCGGPIRRPPPRREYCSGAKRQQAEFKCMALKRNSNVFRACTRRKVIHIDFSTLYTQCVLDVCMMGRSSQLAMKVTCDNAQIMADQCEDAGVRIPNWREIYNCPRTQIKEGDRSSPCKQQPKRGPCRGSHTRYYFNQDSGTCRVFSYSGCGGNANRFDKFTDCMTECAGGEKQTKKIDDCRSTELSVNLMQKLRTMVTKLESPAPSVRQLVQVTNMMKDVTTQFNILMKFMMEMRKERAAGKTVTQYKNLQQMIASLLTVVKQAINKRYTFPDNKYLTQNSVTIKKIIEQFRVMNKMYEGKEKTSAFITAFQKKFKGEDQVVVQKVLELLKGSGNLSEEKIEAIKILMPTLVMSQLEKLSHGAVTNNAVQVKVVTSENLQKIQSITSAAEKRMITV